MTRAGEMDRRARFERNAEGAVNGFNESSDGWGKLCNAWAKRVDISDKERIATGAEASTLVARFTVRSTPKTRGLTTDDRLICDGATWNIRGVKEARGGRNRFIEVTAESVSG